ncbi:MAG: hypothetical protein KIT68_06970 [Phycisphaeraceae bacterium]|nr:hypothetical protein [Phycisphaeraceae bacterium]
MQQVPAGDDTRGQAASVVSGLSEIPRAQFDLELQLPGKEGAESDEEVAVRGVLEVERRASAEREVPRARLEESLAFTERAVERFGGQLEDVSRGLERLLKRMESLERRVDGLAAASREVGPGGGDAERTTEPE